MKQRGITFTDDQWQIVTDLAAASEQTAGEWIRAACETRARSAGIEWPAAPQWGEKSRKVNPHTTEGPSVRLLQDVVDRLNIPARVVKARGGEQDHLGYCLQVGDSMDWLGETFVRATNALRARYGDWNTENK